MLPTFNATAVLRPASYCTKWEVANARCVSKPHGWVCEKGHPGETCYEEWYMDSQGCPTKFAACAATKGWADCKDC